MGRINFEDMTIKFESPLVVAMEDCIGIQSSRLSRRTCLQPVHNAQAGSLRARTGKMPIFRLFASLLFVLGTVASAQAKLNVVATLPDFGSLAREIGGDKVNVTVLAKPTEDPHFVDARPSFVVQLRSADVLIDGGAELELGWLPPLLQNARNPKIEIGKPGRVIAAQGVRLMNVPANVTRAAGDVHALGNPHFMTDPIIAKAVAQHIAQSFAAVDVAAYHDSWVYFAHRFGLEIDVFLEPKPGIPPSPSHLVEVIAQIKSQKIKAIIVEPFHERKIAEKVASATGAKVVDFSQFPGGLPETDTYVKLIDTLVSRLAAALE